MDRPEPSPTAEAPGPEATAADPFSVLSIGALSRATGVPVETLRTWERRYGFPSPIERSESGHRRYPLETAERLRLVVKALEGGHKPAVVLRAAVPTLRELIAVGAGPGGGVPDGPRRRDREGSPTSGFVERCLHHTERLDGEALVHELEHAWNELGALEFLQDRVAPFLTELGEAWSRQQIEVGHEHFASEHVREFLSGRWRSMSERADGPRIVCAAPEGELHVMGLHMAATALALAGAEILFLGASTPPEDIARTARQRGASGVALSAAAGCDRDSLERTVSVLRDSLPPSVPVVVGGAGFTQPFAGTTNRSDLRQLAAWARELPRHE